MGRIRGKICVSVLILIGLTPLARAQDLASFEKRITVKTLENGLTVLVCERPEAPVFSFFTHVNVGADREEPGITGLAHMFEHMAFKGTDRIGTTNYTEEKLALEKVEQAYQAYDRERRKEVGRDDQKASALEKSWKDAMAAAQKYVVENQFGQIVEQQGGRGLNAFTDSEETGYHYSFPSNQVELWAYLESERFLHPVLREFYKERDVVHEERRLSESRPFGRLIEQFLATAYVAHPYGQPVVGWPSDLECRCWRNTSAAFLPARFLNPFAPLSPGKLPSGPLFCVKLPSPSFLRATTSQALATKTMPSTKLSRTSCPTDAPHGCIARSSATRKSPPFREASMASPERNIPICSFSSRSPPPAIPRTRFAMPFMRRLNARRRKTLPMKSCA